MRPGVRTATLDGYVGLARSAGLDPERILTNAGIAVADLAVLDKWVPAAAVARVLERSANESGLEDFGLRLAGLRRLATLGPLSVVLSQEPDLRSALTLLCRYWHSYNEALRMRLDEDGDLATMRLWFEFGEPAPTRQALELATAALLGIVRELPANVTLGLIAHDMDLVFSFAARISVLAAGALFAEGTVAEISRDPQVKAIYLGEDA